ncbi:MAG: hypothetical protein IJU50_07270, partial [Lachnospiraceae bacterium]|nr:hypothetical protein [Lachnospiraceae bacterium]
LALRKRLIKNELCLLLLSKGTPYLFMSDEAGGTQQGNNNPYCQDNEVSWVSWRPTHFREELFAFAKKLLEIRKSYPCITEQPKGLRSEGKKSGYPELSFHGEEAFRPDFMSYSRQVGIYFNGDCYGCDGLYIALNMHWRSHRFALPPERQGEMEILINTHEEASRIVTDEEGKRYLVVPDRTVCVLSCKQKE